MTLQEKSSAPASAKGSLLLYFTFFFFFFVFRGFIGQKTKDNKEQSQMRSRIGIAETAMVVTGNRRTELAQTILGREMELYIRAVKRVAQVKYFPEQVSPDSAVRRKFLW